MSGYLMPTQGLQAAQAQLAGLQKQYEQLQALMTQSSVATEQAAQQQVQKVTGIEGARAYHLGPNSSVALFDTEDDVFYFRSTDANGVENPMKIGRFKIEDAPKADSDFVTVKDFEALKKDLFTLLTTAKDEAKEA